MCGMCVCVYVCGQILVLSHKIWRIREDFLEETTFRLRREQKVEPEQAKGGEVRVFFRELLRITRA